MSRRLFLLAAIATALLAAAGAAQEGPQRGTIKKVDTANDSLVLAVAGKDVTLRVTPATIMKGADNQNLAGRIKSPDLKVGRPVMFIAQSEDGKQVLRAIKLIGDKDAAKGKGGAGGEIQRGKIKKLDLDKLTVTLSQDGNDREFYLDEETRVLEVKEGTIKERLKGFKDGTEVLFKPAKRDGKDFLDGIKLFDGTSLGGAQQNGERLTPDTSNLKPLTEMADTKYQGFSGGLYGDGKNQRPKSHEAAGLALAKQVQPLDENGKPSPTGRIVMISVGMSNTSQASNGFMQALKGDADINPSFLFVNGAVGGQTAFAIQDPNDNGRGAKYWAIVDERFKEAGVTRAQVQAIWIKQADAGPSSGFPKYAKTLQDELTRVVQIFPERFPNCKLVYLSSRTYGGYATTKLNPEPYAFESGFSVQWLIGEQLKGNGELNFDPKKGKVRSPWLSWGPYLWANGTSKRADGFYYDPSDFGPDGTHHTNPGSRKIGEHMLQFFKTDTTARSWFVKAGASPNR